MTTYTVRITHHDTGEQADIARCVTHRHPQWVHDQLGTTSEGELQLALDQCSVDDWYRSGEYLGPDDNGLEMFDSRSLLGLCDQQHEIPVGSRVAAGHGEDHDTGILDSYSDGMAIVRWDSGVVSPAHPDDLEMLAAAHPTD